VARWIFVCILLVGSVAAAKERGTGDYTLSLEPIGLRATQEPWAGLPDTADMLFGGRLILTSPSGPFISKVDVVSAFGGGGLWLQSHAHAEFPIQAGPIDLLPRVSLALDYIAFTASDNSSVTNSNLGLGAGLLARIAAGPAFLEAGAHWDRMLANEGGNRWRGEARGSWPLFGGFATAGAFYQRYESLRNTSVLGIGLGYLFKLSA